MEGFLYFMELIFSFNEKKGNMVDLIFPQTFHKLMKRSLYMGPHLPEYKFLQLGRHEISLMLKSMEKRGRIL